MAGGLPGLADNVALRRVQAVPLDKSCHKATQRMVPAPSSPLTPRGLSPFPFLLLALTRGRVPARFRCFAAQKCQLGAPRCQSRPVFPVLPWRVGRSVPCSPPLLLHSPSQGAAHLQSPKPRARLRALLCPSFFRVRLLGAQRAASWPGGTVGCLSVMLMSVFGKSASQIVI